MSGFNARGAGDALANMSSASALPFAISTFTRTGILDAGILRSEKPSILITDARRVADTKQRRCRAE